MSDFTSGKPLRRLRDEASSTVADLWTHLLPSAPRHQAAGEPAVPPRSARLPDGEKVHRLRGGSANRMGADRSPPLTVAPEASRMPAPALAQLRIRMGFGVDVIGYSRRPAWVHGEVQGRIKGLIDDVLRYDVGVPVDAVDRQPSGDGMHVFLPPDVEMHRALPELLRGVVRRLNANNCWFEDRIRLRMATVLGPVEPTALGFGGRAVIGCSRLLDSPALREAAHRYRETDLVAFVSDLLYRYVVDEGYPGLAPDEFQRKRVRMKEFDEAAWLWVAPVRGAMAA